MHSCRFCGELAETGVKLGGHVRTCALNPNRKATLQKVADALRGKSLSQEHRTKLSLVIQQKIVEGTWHNSFARTRRQMYKGESFDGTWEVKLAKWFDSNDIVWHRNKESFPYTFEGKQRRYTPDFFLPNIDCYVEVKGWKTTKDEAKWNQLTRKLVVLSGSDLQSLGLDIEVKKDWKIVHA